jgi:hypothetical protein
MMAPMLKPLLISFGEEMTKSLVEKFDRNAIISVDKIRSELDIDCQWYHLRPGRLWLGGGGL